MATRHRNPERPVVAQHGRVALAPADRTPHAEFDIAPGLRALLRQARPAAVRMGRMAASHTRPATPHPHSR
jgi:hypothetical protein